MVNGSSVNSSDPHPSRAVSSTGSTRGTFRAFCASSLTTSTIMTLRTSSQPRERLSVQPVSSRSCTSDRGTSCPVVMKEVARFYQELVSSLSDKMRFVIEEITDGDSTNVGVTW